MWLMGVEAFREIFPRIKELYNRFLDYVAKKSRVYHTLAGSNETLSKEKSSLEESIKKQEEQHRLEVEGLNQKISELESKISLYESERWGDERESDKGLAVIELDKDGKIIRINSLAESVLKYKKEDLTGKLVGDICYDKKDGARFSVIPTLASNLFKQDGTYTTLNIKMGDGKRKRVGIQVDILYEGDNNAYSGARLVLQELKLFRRLFADRGKSVINETAPDVVDEDYRQTIGKHGSELIIKNIDRLYIDFGKTADLSELVVKTLVGIAVNGKSTRGIYLENVRPDLYQKLVLAGFPESNINDG